MTKALLKSVVLAALLLFSATVLVRAGFDHGPALEPVPRSLLALQETDEDADDIAETYRLYCSTCHGDVGQGLTAEWRMRNFPESHQNCWRSRCHTANHDPGGFIFPRTVPAIIGRDTLRNFATAEALYRYLKAAMPYYAPGLLSDEEYRELAVLLARANLETRGVRIPDPLPESLSDIPIPHAAQPPTVALQWLDRLFAISLPLPRADR